MHGRQAGDEGEDGGEAAMDEGGRDTRRRRLWRMALDADAETVAWRHVARRRGHGLPGRSGEGGDDGDGDGGGEAATGRMITDEAASVLEAACAAWDTCSWRGELRNLALTLCL